MAEQHKQGDWVSGVRGRATPTSATSGWITSRPVTGRWSSCCTASPSSGTAGGGRSSRSRRPDSASWHPTRAATTCRRARKRSRPTTPTSSPPTSAISSTSAAPRPRCWSVTTGAEPSPGPWRCTTPRSVERLAILNAAHPRKLSQGLHHPGQLRKSWYFFFFDLPELPETVVRADRWHFFRHFLSDARPAFTKEETDRYIEAWSQPGAATGMINYYRSSVRTPPKRAEAALRPIKGPHPGHLGGARSLPWPRTRRAGPRRRPQPGPR